MTLEAEVGVDPDALLARYRAERDRRLRPDGLGQFVETTGDYTRYRADPWADPDFSRAPLSDEVEVLVIGGGLGGLLLGVQLRKAGLEDVRFVERGADFGGVWYWNRYPGAACDTQSILYLPMLEELGYMPRRKFAPQAEILEHFQRIARAFDLYRDALFQTEVVGLRWDQARARWIVATDRGDAIAARFVAIPSGPMERPKLPGIAGMERFRGHAFHTSRWDYAYTGGNAEGGLSGLSDKAVGIIGTGATAVQCVPHLAEAAKRLYVFQRTPSSIDVRDDQPIDPAWAAGLRPGWQQRLMENFTDLTSGVLADEDLIGDGWTSIMANIRLLTAKAQARGGAVKSPLLFSQLADYMKMNDIRARVDAVVEDPSAAEALKPWYNRFCKRPCFSDDYLPTFNRPNVTLVDTAGRGVDRITEDSVVVDGRAYPVDCLIFSTGFEVGAPFARRIGYDIVGRGGLRLIDKWAAGALTMHGVATRDFPNLFILSTIQSGLSLNFSHMIEQQARHVAYILGRASREGVKVMEVTEQAEADWVAEVERAAVSQVDFQRECTPSYFNFEGDLSRLNARNSVYGGGFSAFYARLADWRARGDMAGFSVTWR